jgi:pyruvate dehydrogenase E2 component (dihydrolipoamide acetyltransferase)
VPQVDVFAPLLFNTAAALGIGRVRERVVAVDGTPAVRPMVSLTCCLDHAVWNGMDAARFLTALRRELESGDFAQPCAVAPHAAGELVAS